MQDRITRIYCQRQLERIGRRADLEVVELNSPPYPETQERYFLSDESGVKRLRRSCPPGSGEHDVGPGFTTWRELSDFLRGMEEMLWIQTEQRESAREAQEARAALLS